MWPTDATAKSRAAVKDLFPEAVAEADSKPYLFCVESDDIKMKSGSIAASVDIKMKSPSVPIARDGDANADKEHKTQAKQLYVRTAEHWFHRRKFAPAQPDKADQVLAADTAKASKAVNNSFKRTMSPADKQRFKKWWVTQGEQTKGMRDALRRKFDPKQNPALCAALLSTGDKLLFEIPSRSEKFWSGPPSSGRENVLGKLLMERRQELRDCAAL
jgi:predicted NAD-dependent protein-ADP-ribosyltransferase YbiA (DUF1768 family)